MMFSPARARLCGALVFTLAAQCGCSGAPGSDRPALVPEPSQTLAPFAPATGSAAPSPSPVPTATARIVLT